MAETKGTNWDLIVKIVGLVALISSGWWTLYKFRDDRRVDLEHQRQADLVAERVRLQDLNSYVFHRQADLYFDVAKTATILATSPNPKETQASAYRHFTELGLGEMELVADQRVSYALAAFGGCLEQNGASCSRSEGLNPNWKAWEPTQGHLLEELIGCMRLSLQQDRQISFSAGRQREVFCPYD
jgi:hypothetical protein